MYWNSSYHSNLHTHTQLIVLFASPRLPVTVIAIRIYNEAYDTWHVL